MIDKICILTKINQSIGKYLKTKNILHRSDLKENYWNGLIVVYKICPGLLERLADKLNIFFIFTENNEPGESYAHDFFTKGGIASIRVCYKKCSRHSRLHK